MNNHLKLGKSSPKGYRHSAGYYIRDGKLRQKVFWLGRNPAVSLRKLVALEELTATVPLSADGRLIWPPEYAAKVEAVFASIDAESRVAHPTQPPPDASDLSTPVPVFPPERLPARPNLAGLRLHDALDQYVGWWESRNEIAPKTKMMERHKVKSLKRHLPNLPLAEVGYDQLQQLRNVVTARPVTRRQGSKANPDDAPKISIVTAATWLKTLGQAFRWFKKTNRWVQPAGLSAEDLDRTFYIDMRQRTKLCASREERDRLRNPKPIPTLDELGLYYKLATPGQRLYLLMGICLGWRQSQISELRKQDIMRRGKDHFVTFERTKTNVEGELWLCPELTTQLLADVSQTPPNPDNYAMLTVNGMPLLHATANGHYTDSIRLVWDCLRRRVEKLGCRSHPFDSLRRFASQAITNIGDPFLAQVFLAQVPASVLERHYAGRGIGVGIGKTAFERVHDVQRHAYEALRPMFDAASQPTRDIVARIKRLPPPAPSPNSGAA